MTLRFADGERAVIADGGDGAPRRPQSPRNGKDGCWSAGDLF